MKIIIIIIIIKKEESLMDLEIQDILREDAIWMVEKPQNQFLSPMNRGSKSASWNDKLALEV